MSAGRIKISQMPDSGTMAADDLLHLVQGGNNTKLELERLYDAISANGYPRIHVIEGIPPEKPSGS